MNFMREIIFPNNVDNFLEMFRGYGAYSLCYGLGESGTVWDGMGGLR